MIVTWLAGKSSNDGICALQKSIDNLNKALEYNKNLERKYLEEAAKRLEEAKVKHRANDREGSLFSFKTKVLFERAAQDFRDFQISGRTDLILLEKLKEEAMERLRKEDFTAKKSTNVFIYFCLFLLLLNYFGSF
ncbi:uncharacterized protein LOC130512311 [Raphanus sativus]|uniref:Uncharacterized protein LOC130512311 n=1 Tax=Raphanus sativus TaxID=3726 RepID=A0A9W3DQR7_RAPSA|nr:uncharacterized protein LOC130512311 [Raphanus sativus]XP_056866107.1 uncharacterized protein LOC130512311 [Raphanus sativus]